jgi:GNAT superfamily N-acetyltransferase
MGGDIRPTEKTMEFYCGLFRDYTTGRRAGTVVFGANGNAVLMWGETGTELPWDHNLGRWAMGWGTYVRPEHRRKGWAKLMRLSASEYLRKRGFTSVLGGPIPGNKAGMASLSEMGFAPYQETLTLRL